MVSIKKKCTVNPQSKDNNCFQYSVTIALNYQKTSNNRERILKVQSFINNFNWNEINFPPQQQDYKKFETNNESIALNILYIRHDTEDIKLFYKSKFHLTREQQLISLMITDGQKWLYLAVTRLNALLKKEQTTVVIIV